MAFDDVQIPRQKVLLGSGLVLTAGALAACGSGSDTKAGSSSEAATTPPSASTAKAGAAIAKISDVPVGSGVIVDDVVVTQPTAGVFKGFSSTCTHKGCAVNTIADGTIDCPCHGSKFNLDGTVAKGPATKPLEAKAVTVQGDSIVLV
jgi:Rieske Fe-S protein